LVHTVTPARSTVTTSSPGAEAIIAASPPDVFLQLPVRRHILCYRNSLPFCSRRTCNLSNLADAHGVFLPGILRSVSSSQVPSFLPPCPLGRKHATSETKPQPRPARKKQTWQPRRRIYKDFLSQKWHRAALTPGPRTSEKSPTTALQNGTKLGKRGRENWTRVQGRVRSSLSLAHIDWQMASRARRNSH